MGFSSLSRKLERNIQDYGWQSAVRKGVAYLLKPFFHVAVYRMYRLKLHRAAPSPDSLPGFEFRVLVSTDTLLIEEIERVAEWLRGTLRDAIASGDLCVVALTGNRLAGFNLVTCREMDIPLIALRRRLRPGHAWSCHIAVNKDFRRSGVATRLRHRVFDELRGRGIRTLYGGTLRTNSAALQLARRVGFQEIVDIRYGKLLCFQRSRYKRVRT